MIKVAFTSIFYPLFMGRYILEAFLRREDCMVWSTGPYTGRWIPWGGGEGMHLPTKYVLAPNHPTPSGGHNNRIVYKMAEAKCPFEPDIWIEVNSTLQAVGKPSKGVYAIVGTDPHVLKYDAERARADLFFCMQKPYMKAGDIWLPYGYDPVWHAQTVVPAQDREFDATLLGLPYKERSQLFRRLEKSGMTTKFEVGPCYDDARQIYHNTVVGVNWSSLLDTTARVFEIMAFGIAPVLNRVPDLMEMFNDREHFLGFDDEAEALQMIGACIYDKEFAQKLGEKARQAVEPHSWDARAQKILEAAHLVS